MRIFRRAGAVLMVVALLLPAGVVRPRLAVAGGVGDLVEQALPPGARQLLAGIRIIDGVGTRNRVYREAHQVQRQLRAYYDARIETAQRQMINREQLGLRDSQYQAYARVKASLEAERDVAIQITEDEKKAAKYTFEGRLRRELLGAVARSPRGQSALRDIRGVLSDVRERFGQLQAVLEGGNPISIAVGDLQREVDRLRSAGAVISLLSGPAGAELQRKANAVQGLINQVTDATDEAAAAGREAIDVLDGAIGTLDQHIESPRRARAAADLLAEEAVDTVLGTIFTPGGETPAEDVVADAIARGIDRNLVQNVGVAVGELDPEELRTMRERVRAQLLRTRLETIAAQCGRLTGDLHRAALDALNDGSELPESTPCSLFQNPEKLEEFMRDFTGQTNGGQGDPVPSTEALTPDSGFLIEASLIVEPGAAEFAWTGNFAIGDEGEVVGTGQGSGFSKGSCSIEGGDPAPYSFSATWVVDISGTSDDSGIDIVLTPRNPSITQGPGTDESIFCVGVAKGIFVDFTNLTLGGEGLLGVVKVPKEGGTTTVGTEPFLVEVIVTAPQA